MTEPANDLQQRLERYDIIERIAAGGMAEVFLAKVYGAHGFEKTVAIKRILPELARDREFEERFIAEAKVAVKLSHANIVQVFDFGRFGETLFIAMEFVDGLDLAALLRKMRDEKRQVPLPTAFHIAIEIVRGLDFAHQHGVVHRDVSPSNIILSRAGEVKIADFGIAVAARPHRQGGAGPRKVMGKWRYMSPEQTRGDTLDTRSDLFSAASVIFEIFTGEKLFPGEEAEQIIRNIADMPIPKTTSLRAGLPNRLDEILAGPLSRHPTDRPARAAVILRSLIELSYESSIVATSLDLAETVGSLIPPPTGARSAIDDVIRKQLAGGADGSIARQTAVTDGKPTSTAVTESTGMWLNLVGKDGVSRLEHQEPTIIAQPRSRRTSVPPFGDEPAIDRRTEVGSPPPTDDGELERELPRPATSSEAAADGPDSGHNPSQSNERMSGAASRTGSLSSQRVTKEGVAVVAEPQQAGESLASWSQAPVARKRSTLLLLGSGALVMLAAALTWILWPSTNQSSTVTMGSSDAALSQSKNAILDLDSRPSKAEVFVGTTRIGETPFRHELAVTGSVELRFKKAGFVDYVDTVNVVPGGTVRVSPTLRIAPAQLRVESIPEGATVSIDGKVVGTTPSLLQDLAATPAVIVLVSKAGFVAAEQKIALEAGKLAEVSVTLKAQQKFGLINLAVLDADGGTSAGVVFFAGKAIGEAPVQGLRLPVGRQMLVVQNRATGQRKSITVNVLEDQTSLHTVRYEPAK